MIETSEGVLKAAIQRQEQNRQLAAYAAGFPPDLLARRTIRSGRYVWNEGAQHDEHVRRYRFHLQYHDQIQARLRRELPVIHAAQAKRARKNEKRLKGRGL